MPKHPLEILEAFHHLMGNIADSDIARQADVGKHDVVNYRRKHGIQGYRGHIGDSPASAVAKPTQPKAKPAKKSKKAAKPAPSSAAAVVAKAPIPTVADAVDKAPKTAKKAAARAAKDGARPVSRIKAFEHLLGVEIDREVAEKAGVTVGAVGQYRKRLGIPSASANKAGAQVAPRSVEAAPPVDSTKTSPKAAVEAAPPAASTKRASPKVAAAARGLFGYVVTATNPDVEYHLVAHDVVEAAQSAEAGIALRHPGAQVVAIRHLGPALG